MPAEHLHAPLIDRMPAVKGRLEAEIPLARFTWFKVGGPAEVLFRPDDEADLAAFLAGCPGDVPVMVMGNASNLLVRDGGVRGVVIRLGRPFADIRMDGNVVQAGGGAADLNIARAARDAGLAGLEFLAGVPGTAGGAVFMNAGAYGCEVKDVFVSCRTVDRQGVARDVDLAGMDFAYRRSALDGDAIVTAVRLRGEPGKMAEIEARMSDIQSARELSQPVRTPTGGSTFKNPDGSAAWELIEAAGCRGLRRGQAVVSEQHCNFLVNDGGATAADIEALGEEVRRRVKVDSGATLEWEIRRVGDPVGPMAREVSP